MSINRVVMSGNLTRDPELRQTASGTQVLELGVAVNDRRKNAQTGEWEDCPNYIDCTMFGNRAQAVAQYLSKGTKVFIEGKLRWSQWERDGQKHSKVSVIVDQIEWNSKSDSKLVSAPVSQPAVTYTQPQAQGAQTYYQAPQNVEQAQPIYANAMQPVYQAVPQAQPVAASIYDEDIPF